MLAIGKRYGRTKFNGRSENMGGSYVGFLYSLASNKFEEKIAPAFIEYYDANWIIKPKKVY